MNLTPADIFTTALRNRRPGNRAQRRSAVRRMLLVLASVLVLATTPAPAAAADYDGAGYRVYVCKAAYDRGYRDDLNKVFNYSSNDINPAQWFHEDTCDRLLNGNPGDDWAAWVYVGHANGTGPVWNPNRPGGVGLVYTASVAASQGLNIRTLQVDDRVTTYKTGGGLVSNPVAFWHHGTPGGGGNTFRLCNGIGVWKDANWYGPGWKNGESPTGFKGQINDSPFYRASPTGEYTPLMTGSGTHTNPNSVCTIRGGGDDFIFPSDRSIAVGFGVGCQTGRTTDYWCRSNDAARPPVEPSRVIPNMNNWYVALKSANMYVRDVTAPTITLQSGGMNAGGGTAGGDQDGTQEELRFSVSDNSGIRRLRFFIDGRLMETRDMPCDHRYMAPCREATGATGPPGAVNDAPFRYDVDPLQLGGHTVTVEAVDGAGKTASANGSFTVATPPKPDDYCASTRSRRIGSSARGTCKSPTTPPMQNDDVPAAGQDGPAGGSLPVSLPTTGTGIFTYTLAINADPTKKPIDPADCRVRHHVVRSASDPSGALTERELNQVVSVSINLESLVPRASSLGQQHVRNSFDLPARQSSRYRQALGC